MQALKDKTLLIVDDEMDFAEVIGWDFQDSGLKVLFAEGAQMAIEILEVQSVDFILSDIEMPKGNGVELINHIKDKNIDIIGFCFMTGFTERSSEDLLELGIDKFYKKPVQTKHIIEDFIELINK